MNEISLDDITQLEPGQILADSVRQWRPDCKAGLFKIGSSKKVGERIDMELIGAQINEGEFYGYPPQKWLALLFVDPDGVLSTILFKTESLDQFEELRRTYRLKGESLLGKTIKAKMAPRSSKATGNSYYIVEFEVVSDGKYAEAIAQFRQLHYSPNFIRLVESKPEEKKAA